ncbi:MAG: hypothetical protein ACTFAL_14040 [Candidatus Electronema sp. V4]|jgi:ABC-type maltose transport system permease subunit|uniref:hypothetical protein n=1 Tax=Candidatus Electronema sp. V4 TaxID=3454756 RepID=UPI0040555345
MEFVSMIMNFFINALGFSQQEILLLFLCPVFAVIGGMIHFYVLWGDYSKLPEEVYFNNMKEILGRVAWLIGRLLLAGTAGLVFSLYLVGALTPAPATTARILACSILIGYAAPRFWVTQEKVIAKVIETNIRKIVEEYLSEKKAVDQK